MTNEIPEDIRKAVEWIDHNAVWFKSPQGLRQRVAEIILAERERCAQIADKARRERSSPTGDQYTCGKWDMAVRIAAKIRGEL